MTKRNREKKRRIPARIFRILLWITGSIFFLLLLLILLIRLPAVQNFITQKAVGYIKAKTGTEVRISRLFISFPKKVHLQGLYVEDKAGDTLIWMGDLKADISLLDLLSNKITINSVSARDVTASVYRLYPDTTFNYSFLLDAFASKDTVPKPVDTGSATVISLGKITLNDIHLSYRDTISGIDAKVDLGEMRLSVKKSDLDKLDFGINDFILNNTNIAMVQSAPLDTTKDADTTAGKFSIALKDFRLDNIRLSYASTADTLEASVKIGSFRMDDLFAVPDSLSLGKILINNSILSYNKQNKPALSRGMDFNHLLVTGFEFEANTISLTPALAKAGLDNLSFKEKSGFMISEFKADIVADSVHASLANLDLQTQHSRIRSHLEAKYPSFDAFTDSIESVEFHLILDRASISMPDVLYFMPALADDPEFKNYINEKAELTGKIDGTTAHLFIRDFDFSAGNVTRIRLDGEALNVTDVKRLFADINLHEFSTSSDDLAVLVPAGLIPPNIKVPEFLHAQGNFKGSLSNFDADLSISSTIGSVDAEVKMDQERRDLPAHYDILVRTEDFDPGKLLNQPDLGPITLELTASGSGMDTSSISADINLDVSHAMLMGYDYHDLSVKGHMEKLAFDGEASMADKNLTFSYKGLTDLNPRNAAFDFVLYLKGADLKALGLTETDSKVSATFAADINKAADGNYLGKASIARMMIVEGQDRFTADSIKFSASENEGKTDISLTSPGLVISASGKIVMTELASAFQKQLSQYYDLSPGADTVQLQAQNFEFRIEMTDPALTEKLVPSLDKLSPFELAGNFNSEASSLNLKGEVPEIIYSGLTIDTLAIDISSDESRLNYDVSSAAIFNSMVRMENFRMNGNVADDSVVFRISSEKEDSGTMIAVSGRIAKQTDGIRIVLDEPLTLANTDWSIDPRNYILLDSNGMKINKLTLAREQESLAVETRDGTAETALDIRFTDFEAGNFSRIIETDTPLVRGKMNGNFTLVKQGFISDLKIDDLTFRQKPVGDLELKASNDRPGTYGIGLKISGGENDLALNGEYTAGEEEGRMDLVLDIRNLSMATAEPFSFGQITDMKGNASGNLKITGTVSKPTLEGKIHFADVGLRPSAIGSPLTIKDNDLSFSGGQVIFEDFTINDSLNNSAVINGYTDISDLKKIGFDMTLKTEDFMAMNTAYSEDKVVFGKVILDSDIHLTGTQQSPVADVRVRLNDGTNVTFVNAGSKAGMIEHEGIVVFSDSISRQHPLMSADSAKEAAVTEIDLKAVIEFDEGATLKMMVDPVAGDSLFVKGTGLLEFTLDPSGTMSMTGNYKIREGGYHLTVSGVLKRDFKIKEGSSVTWNGELMEAETNITAVYEVETSPLILLEDQLSGAGDEQKNKFRNELEFEVLLNMSGEIMKPEISFDIQLNEKDRGAMGGAVYAKLAELREEESQLNKQVFSLLALGRFMGTDPLESGNAPITVSSAARSSASKLLTDQLNDLADRYVTGVDLEVGVKSYEDYSSGQAEGRTELELGLSKELLEGRVIVQVGGSIDVEGEKASQNNISDIAGNLSVEYKVTEDGRYRLKGFRTNEYENPIEGEITKTGVGFIFTRDFNKIRDIYVNEEGKRLDEK